VTSQTYRRISLQLFGGPWLPPDAKTSAVVEALGFPEERMRIDDMEVWGYAFRGDHQPCRLVALLIAGNRLAHAAVAEI
jgi:hypothetical protein